MNDIINPNEGFCFFMKLREAVMWSNLWKSIYLCIDKSFGLSLCEILYKHGIGEARMRDMFPLDMPMVALCQEFFIVNEYNI